VDAEQRTTPSLIHFRGRGFWAENTSLSIWLCALAEEISRVEPLPEWLQVARDHWAFQARDAEFTPLLREERRAHDPEDAVGCIFTSLDGHLNEDEKISLLIEVSERALSRLEQEGPLLSAEVLKTLGLPGDAIGGVEASPCVDAGNHWLALLRGEPYPDDMRRIHYATWFDGIQIAVTDREVASDLWEFRAPVPLSAIEGAELRTSWQHPWIIMSGLFLLLLGGASVFIAVVMANDKPFFERAFATGFGIIFLIAGVLRCRSYFTDEKRELLVTTTDGKRGVLYMNHHRSTFSAFLDGLRKAFAASQKGELPLLRGKGTA